MTGLPRDRLAELLAAESAAEAFSAARTAPPGDLRLEVRGVGEIKLPVPQAQAKQLCLVARPARYGLGEQTLLDRSVRDTWEVPKSRVRIDQRRFNRTLVPVLGRLGRELGLAGRGALKAELHSMLVYAPGQFFVQHQDSEKDDAMVGSLVVGLPSTFTGGALEVDHGGRTAIYRGSKKSLSFVAFYGDCRHQVKAVKSGYRVVLTYNLMLREDSSSTPEPDPELTAEVSRWLDRHFADGPERLAYLLDHEYTARGLGWARLKGADRERARLLAAAAEQAGCETALGLVDIHETWTAYEVRERWYGRSRYSRWREWEDDEDEFDGGEGGDYELEDFIESQVTLERWIEPSSGRAEDVGLTLEDDELCASTPSGELEPYSTEYEGYMGNWGNTLDRWYHRGAVVVWPRGRSFAIRAEASPSWALDELDDLVRRGELAGAREAAEMLEPFWGAAATRVKEKSFFAKALRTARVLDDPGLAAMLLRPFQVETVTTARARALGALVDSYGERWAGELVAAWSANRRYRYSLGDSERQWMATVPRLCEALAQTGDGGASAARLLLRESWGWVGAELDRALELAKPSGRERALAELVRPLAGIVEAAAAVRDGDLGGEVVASLCRNDADVVGCAIAVLRAIPVSRWGATGLDAAASHSSAALQARLARPPRAAEDWSIELPAGCGCELCAELRAFLGDSTRTQLEWPLAEQRRRHVHGRIDASELPVTHKTRRSGRPYTLVLTKTDALFKREAARRRRDENDLAWLERSVRRRAPCASYS